MFFFFLQICDLPLYLGDKNAACDTELLARLKMTHILTAELIPLPHVVTSHFPHMAVMHVSIADLSESDLVGVLEKSIKFIRAGLSSSKGVVLVHCYHGISRSAAIVTAYLMRYVSGVIWATYRLGQSWPKCLESPDALLLRLQYNTTLRDFSTLDLD
jgi:hypothetical protein